MFLVEAPSPSHEGCSSDLETSLAGCTVSKSAATAMSREAGPVRFGRDGTATSWHRVTNQYPTLFSCAARVFSRPMRFSCVRRLVTQPSSIRWKGMDQHRDFVTARGRRLENSKLRRRGRTDSDFLRTWRSADACFPSRHGLLQHRLTSPKSHGQLHLPLLLQTAASYYCRC
jgi:hypothetical protein